MASLTVIVPTHNRAHLLGRALDSIATQSVRDVEVIVVDDGSSDGTAELVRARRDVTYLHVDRLGQVGAVRNVGIERARTNYLAFLDSDDRWLPGKLERQLSILRGGSEDVFSSSNALVERTEVDGDVEKLPLYLPNLRSDKELLLADLLLDNSVIVSTVVARTAAVRASGAFSTLPILRGIEDYDLWLRLMAGGRRARVLGRPLAVYRDIPALSMRGERPRVDEILGLLVIMHRLKSLLDPGDLDHSRLDAAAGRLMHELAFHERVGSGGKTARVSERLRRRTRTPRLRFAADSAPGWTTVAPRRLRGPDHDGGADAYVDVDELRLPSGSLGDVVIVASDALEPDDGHAAAIAARAWLAPGRTVHLDTRAVSSDASAAWDACVKAAGYTEVRPAGSIRRFVADTSLKPLGS